MAATKKDYPLQQGGNSMNLIFAARTVAQHAWHILPHLRPDSHILDVGCGIGSITQDLARRCPDGQVIGLDSNAESISLAQASASAAGLRNIQFLVGDAADLSRYPPDSFDIVHAHQVLLHLPDPVAALREMRRVARTGSAVVAIRDNIQITAIGESSLMNRQQIALEQIMYPARKPGQVAGQIRGRDNFVWMLEAGFAEVALEMGTAGWDFSGVEGRRMWVAGVKDLTVEMGRKLGVGTEEELVQLGRDYDAWERNERGRVVALDSWVIGKM